MFAMQDGLSSYRASCSRVRSLTSKRKRFGPPKTRSRQARDRRDLMLRATTYLEGGPAAVVDTLPFSVGLVHGDFESPRPADEPAPV